MDRYFSVLSQCILLTDGETDRQMDTDRQTDRWTQTDSFLVTRPPCIQCTAVKIGPTSMSNADFLIWNHHLLICYSHMKYLTTFYVFQHISNLSNNQYIHTLSIQIFPFHIHSHQIIHFTHFPIHSITILTVSISYLLIYYFPVHLLGAFGPTFLRHFLQ